MSISSSYYAEPSDAVLYMREQLQERLAAEKSFFNDENMSTALRTIQSQVDKRTKAIDYTKVAKTVISSPEDKRVLKLAKTIHQEPMTSATLTGRVKAKS
jgi:hypothetical protein